MNTKQITMYVVVSNQRKPELYSLRETKGECVATFEMSMETKWKEARKYGWRCIKVDIRISDALNFR